jgi:hypothetical protein
MLLLRLQGSTTGAGEKEIVKIKTYGGVDV